MHNAERQQQGFLSLTDLSKRWGASIQAAYGRTLGKRFPAPVVTGFGRLWDPEDIAEWEAAKLRRKSSAGA